MKVLILGDSHSRCFNFYKSANTTFDLVTVTGCSVQGLVNENSKTNARQTFINALQHSKKYDKVICYFGEVDCNSTIWYYSKKYDVRLKEQFFRSIKNYSKFLKEVEEYFEPKNIFVLGPILPIVSSADRYSQKSIRRSVSMTKSSRTRLTNQFNKNLIKLCNKKRYNYFSVNDILLDTDTKLIKEEFVRNKADHHLNKKLAANLWGKVLPI